MASFKASSTVNFGLYSRSIKKAPEFFQIWYKPRFNYILTFGHADGFVFDSYSNLDSFLGIFYISLIAVINGLVAFYGWKKMNIKILDYESKRGKEDNSR